MVTSTKVNIQMVVGIVHISRLMVTCPKSARMTIRMVFGLLIRADGDK
jgi:hypothetical protein